MWSEIYKYYFDHLIIDSRLNSPHNYNYLEFYNLLWVDFFKQPSDHLKLNHNYKTESIIGSLRKSFFTVEWYKVFDFIEFFANNFIYRASPNNNIDFMNFCNKILERENSGYRFINGIICPITTKIEIEEIEKAINESIDPVGEHLNRSLELLSDRINPDYRNSIKESISAVESMCLILVNKPNAKLSDALKELETKISIHSALKSAFNILYGYTSYENGIRHSLLEISDLRFEDAKFMLVACSAFTNYLKSKSNK